jgi:hypothetical protein
MAHSNKWPQMEQNELVTELYGSPTGARSLTGGTGLLLETETEMTTDMAELFSRPEWQLACRIAASKGLRKSERLPKFLLYVCEQYLLGRAHEITEQRIGTQIFNRSNDYNPGEDNIVRSYARLLRKRLDIYFKDEGSKEAMRIVIPRGGYVPVFHNIPGCQDPVSMTHPGADASQSELPLLESANPGPVTQADDECDGDVCAQPSRRTLWHSWPAWFFSMTGLAAGILIASAGWLGVNAIQAQREQGPAHAVWAELFQRSRNTLIVPSDSGLGILQNLTRHLVKIEEYANGSYISDMQFPPGLDARNFNDLSRERYTSAVSLNITSRLTRLPEFTANRTQVRYARSMTAEDFKNSNVILLGSKHTNPWVSLFEKRLSFKLEYTPEVNESYVLNEHPTGAEQKVYRNSTDATSNHTYGAIAYLPGLDGVGNVLIIQGLNMAATQASADTLFDASMIQPILQQAALPDGALRPFELLVETTSIGANAPGAQIIATRIYPR